MCTAVTYKTKDCYFGRTLDYEFSYGEEFVIVPRNYVFNFKFLEQKKSNYAILSNYLSNNFIANVGILLSIHTILLF